MRATATAIWYVAPNNNMKKLILTAALAAVCVCSQAADAKKAVEQLKQKYPAESQRIERGVAQAAALWQSSDGSQAEFEAFCAEQFRPKAEQEALFESLQRHLETLWGYGGLMSWRLNEPVDVATGKEISQVDRLFANFSPLAHLSDDLYRNKAAFIVALNFPAYTLEEKTALSKQWSRREWAMARLGEVFEARIPAALNQSYAEVLGNAGMYISDYNVVMDRLRTPDGRQIFPDSMVLLTHWNLRDEIKSNYADKKNGLEKQRMVYRVMERIVDGSIPLAVINNRAYTWAPYSNETSAPDKATEDTGRYAQVRRIFAQQLLRDPYYGPGKDTYIKRNFDGGMEVSKAQVEAMFKELVGSEIPQKMAWIISSRLGRPLEPFDLWYDGFKSRSRMDFSKLDSATASRYPTAAAMEAQLPKILQDLGYGTERADYLASKIAVDNARGSGHAMGATIVGGKSRLRTRVAPNGMNYKGYNIAVHELGHNVEQTISLYDVEDYMLNGVPNTSFTEALAFSFQRRDLPLLGIAAENRGAEALYDSFWDVYEIMGVSLVDMELWEWLYANPNASAAQIKEALISIAKNVWNKYYAPAFGVRDATVLGIYSHMISYPLYLSAYPFGLLVHFQLEQHWKNLSPAELTADIDRVFKLGRLTPNAWMNEAVGSDVSVAPLLEAVRGVLPADKKKKK